MARSAKQWLSGQVERIEGEWLFEDLSGSVVIGECERETGSGATLKLHLRSVRHGLVDVFVLSGEGCRIENGEVDLVAKQIVVVSGGEGVFAAVEGLREPRFEGAVLFRLQIRIRDNALTAGESFFEARSFDACGVGEAQPASGKKIAALEELPGKGHTRHSRISKSSVVDETRTGNNGEWAQAECLLPENSLVATKTVGDGRESEVADETIFVLELVSESGLGPTSFQIVCLIVESSSVDIGDGIGRKVEELPAGVNELIDVHALVVILGDAQAVLPARGTAQGKLSAG